MNPRLLLQEQAHRLSFAIDPQHPQDVRAALEEWIRRLRGAQLVEWGRPAEASSLGVLLPAPGTPLPAKKWPGPKLLIRPFHRDLFANETLNTEDEMDAVLEARAGMDPFLDVVAGFLAQALSREGATARKAALRHQRAFERQLRQGLKELMADPNAHQAYLENFTRFLELQEDLVGAPGWETLSHNLELLSRRLDRKKNWRLRRGGSDKERVGELFYLGQVRGEPIFLEQLAMDPGPLGVCSAALVAGSLTRLVRQWEMGEADIKPGHTIQEAFQALPFPLLFLGEKGEVLQHNTAFVKLNLTPSRVGKLVEFDQVQARETSWSVRRMSFAHQKGQRVLYTFLPERPLGVSVQGASGSQDLGIITSSIAHELNNPIAGLLAALQLLSMDEHWGEEEAAQLDEMKQGALRCKQLVETFLGFSRIKTEEGSRVEKELLRRCCEQALHLQRFRMVESELRVNLTYRQQHPFAYPLHPPTATMLVYLVFGEVMTALHHLKLLERSSAKGMVLEARVEENADRFFIHFTPAVTPKQGFSSKLLQYLLQQERLQLDADDSARLLFTHQNVLI